MKQKLVLIVSLLAFYMLPLAQAQDKPTVEKTVTEADEETVDTDVDSQDDDDNFIPTEKINVESSVSFPVDI